MSAPIPDDYRLSVRYTRLASICREHAEQAERSRMRDELLKMAESYDRQAQDELLKETGGTPEAVEEIEEIVLDASGTTKSVFRFADLGRRPGLGAHGSMLGSD